MTIMPTTSGRAVLPGLPTRGDMVAATTAARRAGEVWRDEKPEERARILHRLIPILEAEADNLARQLVQEIGKPVRYARGEIARCVDVLRAATRWTLPESVGVATEGEGVVRYQPLGVVALVTPWNNPLAIPVGKLVPALYHGNTVVWKPAPAANSLAVRFMQLIAEAGWPVGLVNLLCGDRMASEMLLAEGDVDAVTVSGSLATGRAAQRVCAQRNLPYQAELGGNNAAIVWSDADLPAAASQIAEGAFGFAGQRCTANRRVIVAGESYDTFLSHLDNAVVSLAWGDPADPGTIVGPLVSADHRDSVAAVVARARSSAATIRTPHLERCGGDDWPQSGAYYPPTIVCCDDPYNDVVQEETFGPVLVVQRAADWDHALTLCNGVPQGLAAALFSTSESRQQAFLREARAGVLKINQSTAGVGVNTPFGGWKASGFGPPEHGPANREFYTRAQAVYISLR